MGNLTWSLWVVFAIWVITLVAIARSLKDGGKINLKGIFILYVVIPAPFVLLDYLI